MITKSQLLLGTHKSKVSQDFQRPIRKQFTHTFLHLYVATNIKDMIHKHEIYHLQIFLNVYY